MKRIFNKKGLLIIAAAVIIAIITIVSLNMSGNSGFVSDSMGVLTKPLKSASASIAKTFEGLYGYMYKYDKLSDENTALKAQVADLEKQCRDYSDISAENNRLRALLDLTSRHPDFKYDMASIISWSASNWSSSFTISKGSTNSKVKTGDSVISETGVLIGKVTDVGAMSSTAVSVLDTTFSAGVTINSNDDMAIATGDFALMRQGLLRINYLTEDSELNSGDAIITSGKGGIFPKGLIVGNVKDVVSNGNGVGRYATVTPAVDLQNTTYVYLITDFQVTE